MMADNLSDEITIVILAGGRGRRMNQGDKGWVELNQKPLIEHVIDAISRQNSNILISANQSIKRYQALGFPVVSDQLSDFQGPLAGFAAAMEAVETPYILTLPCDAPNIADNYQARMWESLQTNQTDLAVAYDGKRLQSLHALVPIHLRADLIRYLSGQSRKLDTWYSQYAMGLVDFSDQAEQFINLNTPDDLERFSRELK